MSSWNIGIDDVSEETQAFRNKLSSKDGQIAAQETQLMRQAAQLDELKSTLNDALHKLTRETQRALQLETDLIQTAEDLRNEKITSQNIETALTVAHEKIKAKDLEAKDLQATIDSLSHKSDGFNVRNAKLDREKSTLEARVRELEANLRELSSPAVTPGRLRAPRPRSSSLSNFRITTLEQELNDVRISLSQKETDLRAANQKVAHIQSEVTKIDNEKIATEKRMNAQICELQASLEERDEELEYTRAQQGDGTREEELLKRIEEDEAKIAALEKLLGDSSDMNAMKDRLRQAEQRVRSQAVESEARQIDLVREKEEALDELEDARAHVDRLVREKQDLVEVLNAKERDFTSQMATLDMARSIPIPQPPSGDFGPTTTEEAKSDAFDNGLLNGSALYPRQSTPVPQLHADEAAVVYIERLLAAIDRLRGERDNLRRDLQFLETESKYATEALEARIAALSASADEQGATTSRERAELAVLQDRLEEMVRHEAEVTHSKERQIKHLSLTATASAIVIGHLQSQVNTVTNRFFDLSASQAQTEAQLQEKEVALIEVESKFADLGVKLQVTIRSLEEATTQRDDLKSQLKSKDAEWTEEVELIKNAHKDTQANLEQTEMQLANVSQSLEDLESERDSLTLQVTNLQADLYSAQQDLTEAESRYSSLQFHQLSSMSSNEATHVLREQIEELEMRVMRRTEQIGIHQHDIKRLETNLRLQEERLMEMTTELEMMAAQKEAMVEDCAAAREARDEAILRVEGMEVEVEGLEGRVDERERALVGLVAVVMQTVGRSREAIRVLKDKAARHKADQEGRTRQTESELQRLATQYERTTQLLEEKTAAFEALEQHAETSADEVRQTTIALAVSQAELGKGAHSVRMLCDARTGLQSQVTMLQEQLGTQFADTKSLMAQLETLRAQADQSDEELATRTAGLQTRLQDLQDTISTMEAAHQDSVNELIRSKEDIQEQLQEAERLLASNDLEHELDKLRTQHEEELGELQARLEDTCRALEDAQRGCAAAEACHQEALAESARSRQEFEDRLNATSKRLLEGEQVQSELARLRASHADEVACLQEQLDATSAASRRATESRDELNTLHQRVVDELAQTRTNYESRLLQITQSSTEIQQQLEDNLADAHSKLAEQSHKLDSSVQETTLLGQKLRVEVDNRARDQEMYKKELHSATERYQRAEAVESQLNQRTATIRAEIEQVKFELETLQGEKSSLQLEATALEAEIQRSVSMGRFLESQVKEHERTIASLTQTLEHTRVELSRSEKVGQAAEVNLSLQSAQHKREMSDLHRDLAILRSKPDLEVVVAELEERNNEMEELLRSKCAEIEDNDDRVLEMLKENKKLTTKVESLTRKAQNLQAKLAAAKATIPVAASVPIGPTPSSSVASPIIPLPTMARQSNTATPIPPVPPIPAHIASTPITRAPSNRAVSGPSSLPRPKTPERRKALPPVFKARTPEKALAPVTILEPLQSSSKGKKRRAPDDFEACESVPPQGFTVDSVPSDDIENSTPRVRRVLQSMQSGFTPVRHHTARPAIPMPSPKRVVIATAKSSPYIADITNSPRAVSHIIEKSSKRSWLGKIRGVSSQTTSGRSLSSRPVFERYEETS